jgi:hypothetical protein
VQHTSLPIDSTTARLSVKRRRTVDQDLECTPASGQGQAADLTICRACSCSNLTGLRYPNAEWSRLLL